MQIDSIDRHIVTCLVEDGRISFQSLSERVALSSSAVKRRFDRLVKSGVVTAFTALVNPRLLGYRTEGFVHVRFRRSVSPAASRAAFSLIPEIVEAHTVSGAWDVLVRIRSTSVGDFERVLEQLRASPLVHNTESTMVLTTLLNRPGPVAIESEDRRSVV
ncbi:Lrp/AsnC family transcriptional regulator [Nakamurella silvestris]|nr:Lrp/AsnC family transcriptional regulator [Nakamurella silvestris]